MKTSPVFSILKTDGQLFWLDLEWGQGWANGCGYLAVVHWGEERTQRGFCKDNRVLVDPNDCEIYPLGWTQEIDPEYEVPRLMITAQEPGHTHASQPGREGKP